MNYLLIEPLQKALFFTPRTGSTATARAILTTHYPEKLSFAGWHLPQGVTEPPLQRVVPNAPAPPDGYAVAVVLRDPIERFRSGCGHAGITVAQGIQQLRDGRGREFPLFAPIAKSATKDAILFKFETQLSDLAAWLGTGPIIQENESASKPTLTEQEIADLELLYAEDIEIYNNGFEAQPEPLPPTQAECIALGEQHVLNAGITGFRLAALQNRLLETKAACEAATPPIDIAVAKPKLVALYTWLKTVEAMAIAGSVAFPPAPHTFEEVVSE